MDILIAAVMGLVIGEVVRRRLNTLTYRRPAYGEGADETVLPVPGSRWWIPVILAVAWACVAWFCPVGSQRMGDWAVILGWMGFSGIGLGLAVIDLDVRRLPDRGQIWLAGVSLVSGVLVWWGQPTRLLVGLGAALGCGLAFWIMHLVSRGDLGLGDVKLVMTCGWWLGLGSVVSVVVAVIIACLLAVAYSLLAGQRQFAFGPWLLAGTIMVGLYVI